MNNSLNQIEAKFNVSSVKVYNYEAWPILRSIYFFHLQYDKIKNTNVNKLQTLIRFITNATYGFSNLFKKTEYLFFSTPSLRKMFNNVLFDKSFDSIINILGQRNCLMLEQPTKNIIDSLDGHYPRNLIFTNNVVSTSIFDFISIIFEKIWLLPLTIQNEEILKSINTEINFELPYSKFLKRFLIKRFLYKIFLRIFRPKLIFINCSYINQHILSAASILQIPTIEVQHGAIGSTDLMYNYTPVFDKEFTPTHLLTFGDFEVKTLSKSSFSKNCKIHSIGNWYLSEINSITSKISKKNTIIVALQDIVEEELLMFTEKLSMKLPSFTFLIFPRGNRRKIASNLHNIKVLQGKNIYDYLSIANFHITIFSTTAIEAPVFGCINILYDHNNLARNRFKTDYSELPYFNFVDDIESAYDIITNSNLSFEKIIDDYSYYIRNDFNNNVTLFLNHLNL